MDKQKHPFTFPILVIVGPTAIGKTALALQIAQKYNFEIISMDSMQVYRYMDIGTAKVTPEEQNQVSHHLIDIVNPDGNYNAACFRQDALQSIEKIYKKKKLPLLTGGTGLYLNALLYGISPEAPANNAVRNKLQKRLVVEGCEKLHKELMVCDKVTAERVHPHDTQRLLRALEIYKVSSKPWSEHIFEQSADRIKEKARFPQLLQIGLTCPRERLYQRINQRSELMLDLGLEQEVLELREMGYSPNLMSMQSIGYRHMNKYVDKKHDKEEMLRLLARDTRRYAKRQYTWFNKNKELTWINVKDEQKIFATITKWLERE